MSYIIKDLEASVARDMVKKYHYSGKVVSNSHTHLGVFNSYDELVGVMQFGPPMNGGKTGEKILSGFRIVELNRMVMADSEPRNSESMAISLAIKYMKKKGDFDYILSFSDGKQGNVGYIYQATNWMYIGYLLSDSFYKIDDEYVHAVTVWHRYKEKHPKRDSHTTNEIVCLEHKRVSKIKCKQHIYLFALNKRTKAAILNKFPMREYPKKDKELTVLEEVVYKDDNGIYLPSGKKSVYHKEDLRSVI